MNNKFLLATSNKMKINEFKEILSDVNFINLNISKIVPPIENSDSFSGNAKIKSEYYSNLFKDVYVLSEDSGIEIKDLNGFPGINSKRWSNDNYEQKILTLLSKCKNNIVSARYVCAISISLNGKEIDNSIGICEGNLVEPYQGSSGFGYDIGFVPLGFKKTMEELGQNVKKEISHRRKAINKLKFIVNIK